MFTLRNYQLEAVNAAVRYLQQDKPANGIIVLPTGCHVAGTKVVMYDLSTRAVENIEVGDLLMGPDGNPRKVIRLVEGYESLYRIEPIRGSEPFIVNGNHVLSLVSTNEGKSCPSYQTGTEITNITVEDYLAKSKSWKHLRKLYRSWMVGQHIETEDLPIQPWLLGVILGDGCTTNGHVSVCNPDIEIIDWVKHIVEIDHGCTVTVKHKNQNKAVGLDIVKAYDRHDRTVENELMAAIRYLGLDGKKAESKFVPDCYKRGSIETRFEILAGLIDTDGYHDGRGGYDYISKSKQLAEDVAFIARSLGITAHLRPAFKKCQTGAGGIYHRVSLSGFTHRIPCKVARKKPPSQRLQIKDPLRTGFQVKPAGFGKFYGFELTGDHLYMTEDFTVHHNSGKSLVIANIVKRLQAPTLVFQPSKEILEQNHAKLESYGYKAGIYSASLGLKRVSEITLATIGSVKNHPDLFSKFRFILIDECHLVNAKGGMYKTFIEGIEQCRVLGLTATPYRLATNSFGSELRFLTRTRPRVFRDVVYYVQNSTLFDAGFLAPIEYIDVRGFDRSRLRPNSTGAEFDENSVRSYQRATNFLDHVVEKVREVSFLRKNALVFTRFIEESEFIVRNVPGAVLVTGETPKIERDRIGNAFRKGTIKVVCNCGVYTTGFDYPELETVVLARATMSLGLLYQMIGRGIRPHPLKRCCQVVDMCGNVNHFGKIEDLKLVDGGNGKWFIESRGRQLTNVLTETSHSTKNSIWKKHAWSR